MNVQTAVFFMLSAVIAASALAIMFTRNVVHCVVYMLIVLTGLAGTYMMLDAGFIAAAQVLVYAGAVTVLMLFIIMLTMTREQSTTMQVRQSTPALVIALALWGSLLAALTGAGLGGARPGRPGLTADLASVLFTKEIIPFEIAGVILLAALVGAAYLAKGEEK